VVGVGFEGLHFLLELFYIYFFIFIAKPSALLSIVEFRKLADVRRYILKITFVIRVSHSQLFLFHFQIFLILVL